MSKIQLIMASDYAIRSLLYLTLVGRTANAAEISDKTSVPKQYLITMSRKLKDGGLLGAEPGVSGGYYLLRRPEDITLLDIIRVTEGTSGLNRCTQRAGARDCFAEEKCPVIEVYDTLQTTVEELLGGVTLADLKRRMREPA